MSQHCLYVSQDRLLLTSGCSVRKKTRAQKVGNSWKQKYLFIDEKWKTLCWCHGEVKDQIDASQNKTLMPIKSIASLETLKGNKTSSEKFQIKINARTGEKDSVTFGFNDAETRMKFLKALQRHKMYVNKSERCDPQNVEL